MLYEAEGLPGSHRYGTTRSIMGEREEGEKGQRVESEDLGGD